MSTPRLVVFDMDGTLIDSQETILAAMRATFAAEGIEAPPRPEILGIVGLSLPEAVATLAPDLDPDIRHRLVEGYRRRALGLRADGTPAPLYPGARAALDRLAAEPWTLLGVATGKARRGLDHAFAEHGIGHFFVTSQTADAHPSKPHPSMLLSALAETGCGPDRACMVGDTVFDVAMGRAAGMATIGVAWGYHPAERLHAAGADRVIEAFDALDAALADLIGAP